MGWLGCDLSGAPESRRKRVGNLGKPGLSPWRWYSALEFEPAIAEKRVLQHQEMLGSCNGF